MSWVKVDDRIFLNPKFREASDKARLLYFSGLCFAAQAESDGAILDGDLPVVGAYARADDATMAAKELVSIGLWEKTHAGYQIHDYLEFQPSRAYLASERKRKREWISATRHGSSGATSPATGDATSGECAPSRPVPDPLPDPMPVPTIRKRPPAKPAECSSAFLEFWKAYPRKVAKGAAVKAWPGDEHLPAILGALAWQAKTWTDPKFTPHPATWLNQRRWEDEKQQEPLFQNPGADCHHGHARSENSVFTQTGKVDL